MALPRIPDLPDLTPRRRLVLLALVVTLVVAAMLGARDGHDLRFAYGDTDDAMRLVLARQLLNGRGWWDQRELVLQPPVGVYMHWSRLLDGGIAGMERVFSWFLSWRDAETATRFLWPLMWIFPAVGASLVIARRLGERTPAVSWAIGIAAVILAAHLPLYNQFRPGRVDHHDAQMVFFLLAFAGAVQPVRRRWGAALAGVATGLGCAIGLEALVFQALIGAAIALRFVFAAEEEQSLDGYGAGLVIAILAAFLIQTPPTRWLTPACDALAWNLVVGIVVAGLGLIGAARLTRTRGPWVRLLALGVVGIAAGAAYLGLDHNCIHGPFADVDPRIKPFWLNYVQEVSPLPRLFKRHPDDAVAVAAPVVLGFLAWLWLGRTQARRSDAAWRLSGGLLLITGAAGYTMVRAAGYAAWVAVPLIAAAAADLAWRYRRLGALAPLVAAIIVLPLGATGVALAAGRLWTQALQVVTHAPPAQPAPKSPEDLCFNSSSYRDLAAARPVGLAMGDIDFGPFVLALTPHSTLSAPYHRMNWGIMAARGVLIADADDAGPNGAEAKARALGVGYVLECKAHKGNADRSGIAYGSLQAMLDRGDWPDWLELISDEKAPVQVFRVLPVEAAQAPSIAPRQLPQMGSIKRAGVSRPAPSGGNGPGGRRGTE
jgi:hypothetical protein